MLGILFTNMKSLKFCPKLSENWMSDENKSKRFEN